MKLLRLIYVLLSLAGADLGFLLVRLSYVLPDESVFTPLLFVVGFLLLAGGVLVGLGLAVSLIWLVIAYEPPVIAVAPEKIRFNAKLLLVCLVLNGTAHYWLRPTPAIYKSTIVFTDPAVAVQDSMNVLRQLCESMDAKAFLSCSVRSRDSTLFFSVPGPQHLASLPANLGRIDTITASNEGFRYMNKQDASRLLTVVRFLNRNLIAGIIHDTSVRFWRYPYGVDEYDNGIQWIRYLYRYNSPKDTLSPSFKYYMTIKDQREQLVLVGINDVPYRLFR